MSDYTYSVNDDTLNGIVSGNRLASEVEAGSIAPELSRVTTDGDVLTLTFDGDLSEAEITTLTGIVNAHKGNVLRSWMTIIADPEMHPVVPGASKVVANDRPAVEVSEGVTGYAAMQQVWPLAQNDDAQLRVIVKFILKATGTGSRVRIGVRAKAQGTGADSAAAFTSSGFVAVPVTFTTIGQVFEGVVALDASDFDLDDALALQVGRDGENLLGAGDNDDVNQAIQIIAIKAEGR